jgi:hypothetical protein
LSCILPRGACVGAAGGGRRLQRVEKIESPPKNGMIPASSPRLATTSSGSARHSEKRGRRTSLLGRFGVTVFGAQAFEKVESLPNESSAEDPSGSTADAALLRLAHRGHIASCARPESFDPKRQGDR